MTGEYEFKTVDRLSVHQFRKVNWLLKDVEYPYEEVYGKQFSQQSIYRFDKNGIKKDFFVKRNDAKKKDSESKNYVLIIDEINRGNIAQIFGELISLIETDKRGEQDEALSVILPYSKLPFSVPNNLFIIGTMNTADRSVEALDTALRRRFVFEEMMPDSDQLSTAKLMWRFLWKYKDHGWEDEPYRTLEKEAFNFFGVDESFKKAYKGIWDKMEEDGMKEVQINSLSSFNFTGIDLKVLLDTINNRLTALLNKDHKIGHAWLMNVYCIDDLRNTFKYKLLPLLQEYFYNDYAKIGLILGDKFITQDVVEKGTFAKFKNSEEILNDYDAKIIYKIANPYSLQLIDFLSIYR